MSLKIMPHGRLQEWVAEEKGFFTAEGLDYTFLLNSGDYGIHSVQRDEGGEVRTGAFETFGAGRACHVKTGTERGVERMAQVVVEPIASEGRTRVERPPAHVGSKTGNR